MKSKNRQKKIINSLRQYVGIFMVMFASFFLLLTITSLIPSSMLKENIQKSVEYLNTIGEKQFISLKNKTEQLFIYTDELILNTAYSIDNREPIYSFITAKRNYVPGKTRVIYEDEGKIVPTDSKYGSYPLNQQLELTVKGEIDEAFEYARYWHGYLVFLRPLLVLFSYEMIRILSVICFFAITLWCIYLIMKKINLFTSIAFLVMVLSVYLPIASSSLNEITCYYIAIVACIILLLRKKEKMSIPIFFFIIGGITSFLDLLTNPIVTFAIPFMIYFLQKQQERDMTWKEELILSIKVLASWGIGYLLLWASKWILADILYQRDIIKKSVEQIIYRMVGGETESFQDYSLWDTIKRNLEFWNLSSPIVVIVFGFCVAIYGIIKNKPWKMKGKFAQIVPYVIAFILPIIWIVSLKNHSFWHAFFVYRIFCIMVLAFLIIVAKIVGIYGKKE